MVQLADDQGFRTNEPSGLYAGSVVSDYTYKEEEGDRPQSDGVEQHRVDIVLASGFLLERLWNGLKAVITGIVKLTPHAATAVLGFLERPWNGLKAVITGILKLIVLTLIIPVCVLWLLRNAKEMSFSKDLSVFLTQYLTNFVLSFSKDLSDSPTPNGVLSDSPKLDLANFVHSMKEEVATERTTRSAIGDIEMENFESFSGTYCLEGVSLQTTRDALSAGLSGVPDSVRDDVVNMTLREGITATNTWKNSNADLVNTSKAHSYMSFYSTTAYEVHDNGMDRYKTCVMVSGVTFTVAAENEHQERSSGVAVFEPRGLSLQLQKELHTWMIQQAIESAGHLVAVGSSASDDTNERSLSSRN
jgi:hypothetical protein